MTTPEHVAARPHKLVVHSFDPDEGPDYEIEHFPDCPQYTVYHDPTVTAYDCAVGFEEINAGLMDALDLKEIAPGTYTVERWEEVYPGGPWGSTEYDAGLCFVEEGESDG